MCGSRRIRTFGTFRSGTLAVCWFKRSPILPCFDDAKVERESEVFFRSRKKVSKKLFFERFFQKKGFKESLFRHFAAFECVFMYTPIHIYIYSRPHDQQLSFAGFSTIKLPLSLHKNRFNPDICNFIADYGVKFCLYICLRHSLSINQ